MWYSPSTFSGPNENVSEPFHDMHIDIAEDEQADQVCYVPVCREWQKDHCRVLGLPYIHGNWQHQAKHVMFPVTHCPLSRTSIVPDGNCFFRTLSYTLTGSQAYHPEVCLLDTTYMVDNSADPQLSCFLNVGETVVGETVVA